MYCTRDHTFFNRTLYIVSIFEGTCLYSLTCLCLIISFLFLFGVFSLLVLSIDLYPLHHFLCSVHLFTVFDKATQIQTIKLLLLELYGCPYISFLSVFYVVCLCVLHPKHCCILQLKPVGDYTLPSLSSALLLLLFSCSYYYFKMVMLIMIQFRVILTKLFLLFPSVRIFIIIVYLD